MARAKGWTHPDHWVVASVGTLCQIIAIVLAVLAIIECPLFKDKRNDYNYNLVEMQVKCEDEYCYYDKFTDEASTDPSHVYHVENKARPEWLNVGRNLILVGVATNGLSLFFLLIFWPVVCAGKVINALLHLSRAIDFLGAPTKFIGCFIFIWRIGDINISYSWWKHEGLLMMDPLPIGLILFSYILQTVCFVCTTLATDNGVRGKENHWERIKAAELAEGNGEDEKFRRVSYHPIDQQRSSRVLAEVAQHFQSKDDSNV